MLHGMHTDYMKSTTPCYIGDLSIFRFCIPGESWNPVFMDDEGNLYFPLLIRRGFCVPWSQNKNCSARTSSLGVEKAYVVSHVLSSMGREGVHGCVVVRQGKERGRRRKRK